MSGICGAWQFDHPAATNERLSAMTGELARCGSDSRVLREVDGNGGVGAAARFETQQVHRGRGSLVVCDAELYNEDELRNATGLKEESIAQVLSALYERHGIDLIKKLRGAFALVLWDHNRARFFASVDHFGQRRLVYRIDQRGVIAASRIGALLAAGVPREVNPRCVPNVLNFSVNLSPDSAILGVKRLQPAQILEVSRSRTQITTYWDMRYAVTRRASEEDLAREMVSVVEASVAAHCKDDPFDLCGAFLSGGTDSSTVVGLMSGLGRGPVKSFSIGFAEQPFNELAYAEIAARRFKADHHTYLVTPNDCFEALPKMICSFDEPFGNSSAIATFFCARLAAQSGVKILLAGDGGDELFGGNEWYASDKVFQIYQDIPSPLRKWVLEPMLRIVPFETGVFGKARRYVRRASLPPFERVMSYLPLCEHSVNEVFEPDFLRALGGHDLLEIPYRYYREAPASDHLDRLLYHDLKVVIGDSDLPKVTCMSELAGIRSRFPFLDLSVAEFSGRIPSILKVKGFQKRYLFKQAFRNLLPVEIMQKKKHGFGIPVADWMKSDPKLRDLARDTLLSRRAFERGYFRRQFIEELFRKHEADESSYYGDTIWSFLTLELWHQQFVDVATGVWV